MVTVPVLCAEQIAGILDKFPIWKEYKDQKHDLFLNERPVSGYLTGWYSRVTQKAVTTIVGRWLWA